MGQVVKFPSAIVMDQKVREAERTIAKLLGYIEDAASNPKDGDLQIKAAIAPPMLDMWREMLEKAKIGRELIDAVDTMRHGGIVYRAQPSQNGAH